MDITLGDVSGVRMGNVKTEYYEVLENSDQIEGRGPMVAVAWFGNLELAVEDAKGRGMYGYGSGDVVKVIVEFLPNQRVKMVRDKVYGYRQGRNGKGGYGYIDLRDEKNHGEEYEEYLRLKKKFGE